MSSFVAPSDSPAGSRPEGANAAPTRGLHRLLRTRQGLVAFTAALERTATPEAAVVADWLNHVKLDHIAYMHGLTRSTVEAIIAKTSTVSSRAQRSVSRCAADAGPSHRTHVAQGPVSAQRHAMPQRARDDSGRAA
jgi:hypothetical protein